MTTTSSRRWSVWIVVFAVAFSGSCRPGVESRVARIIEWERQPTAKHVDRIRESLGDEDAPVRAGALAALVRLGTPDAKERARAALGDPDGGVRATAAACLLDLRDAEAVPLLVRVALGDADWRARRGAVEAVGTLAAAGSAAEIAGALDDASSQVRLAAVGAVMRLGPAPAVEALARLSATENSWEVRAAATEALGRTSSSDAYAPAKAALSDANEFVRASAAAALRELRRTGVAEPEEALPAEAAPAGSVLPGQRPQPPAAKPVAGTPR